MDSRILVALATLALPAVLLAVTIWKFSSNPLALVGLFAVIVIGSLYLLTYTETFEPTR